MIITFHCSRKNFFHPKQPDDLENWCGGNGVMLAVDPDGIIYPCLRYMESSLAGQQEPYSIGDVDTGICQTECDRCRVECLKKIDRRTQSTDECFNCPVAEGCSWCTAYNYQVFGTPDARATYICDMHKARALGNIYFWNHYYEKIISTSIWRIMYRKNGHLTLSANLNGICCAVYNDFRY